MTGSYEVKFWDIKKLGDTNGGRWRVRWMVAGREHQKSLRTKTLASGFLDELKDAARAGRPFDPATGLPVDTTRRNDQTTWYAHARGFTEMKWPHLAAKSRRSLAEALTTLTCTLVTKRAGTPEPALLRRALFAWAFNPSTRNATEPEDITAALEWAAAASLPVTALDDPAHVRAALDACAVTLAGKPAAATTVRRKRSVFHNACAHAVELRLLDANPVARTSWKAPQLAETVDRRSVANPKQVRALLAAVRSQGARGERLEAFFGCLYYAGMRPSEVIALREADCHLPDAGWGRLDLAGSEPRAGRAWTDTGAAREARGLKHRAATETRSVPIPPVLVELLKAHIKTYGTTADGRLFRTARDKPLQDSAYSAVWQKARAQALNEAQVVSPLARRPYDLRHAAVSLWLNSGVPVTEVARRAGHGIAVLLRVYANCIDGHTNTNNHRIDQALDEGDDGGK